MPEDSVCRNKPELRVKDRLPCHVRFVECLEFGRETAYCLRATAKVSVYAPSAMRAHFLSIAVSAIQELGPGETASAVGYGSCVDNGNRDRHQRCCCTLGQRRSPQLSRTSCSGGSVQSW